MNLKWVILIIMLLGSVPIHAQPIAVMVISHPDGAPAAMNQTELKSILMGERQRWRNGTKIKIALLKTNTPIGKYVCESIYQMSADEFKKYWLSLVFQGKAEAPAFFNNLSDLQDFVAENPGAIGIIDPQPAIQNTQIVMIDGKETL